MIINICINKNVLDITPEVTFNILKSDNSSFLIDIRTDAEWIRVGVPDIEGIVVFNLL
jgi:hypothetical protein